MHTILTWIAGIFLFLAAAFSGALLSGDRIRANDAAEQPDERLWRIRAALFCMAVGGTAGLLAWATA